MSVQCTQGTFDTERYIYISVIHFYMVIVFHLVKQSTKSLGFLSGVTESTVKCKLFPDTGLQMCDSQMTLMRSVTFLEPFEIFAFHYLSGHRMFCRCGLCFVYLAAVALCIFLCLCYLLRNPSLWSII